MFVTFATTLYNEELNILRIREFYTKIDSAETSCKFIFVDNNSTDNTYQKLLNEFKNLSNVKIVRNKTSRGYGDGFRRIIQETESPYVLIYPGDFQFDQDEIFRFLSLWREKYKDVSHCSYFSVRRRLDGIYSGLRGLTWRLLLCAMFRIPFRLDPASQLRILCIDCIPETSSSDFTVDIEIVKKMQIRHGAGKMLSSTVNFTPRLDGKSSIEKGLLITELRVAMAAIKLRRKLL